MSKLKFNKGDSVIVNSKRPKYERRTGKIYNIQPAQWVGDKTTYNVKLSYGEIVPFRSNELDTYEPPKPNNSTKFEVGDRVRDKNNLFGKGTITTIKQPSSIFDKVRYYVSFEGKPADMYFYSNDLVKLEEKSEKDKPIQLVDFRSQDTVKSEEPNEDWNTFIKKTNNEWNKFITEKNTKNQ